MSSMIDVLKTPWELRRTVEGSPFVIAEGDVIAVPDANNIQPNEFDTRSFKLIAAAPAMLKLLMSSIATLHPESSRLLVERWIAERDALLLKLIGWEDTK